MNDSELKSKLNSVRVPERTDDYWTDFPSRVRLQLPRERREFVPQSIWRPRLSWASGLAVAALLIFICIQFQPLQKASAAIARHQQHLRLEFARFNAGLHVLMLDQHGMSYLVAEKN